LAKEKEADNPKFACISEFVEVLNTAGIDITLDYEQVFAPHWLDDHEKELRHLELLNFLSEFVKGEDGRVDRV